MFVAPSEVMRLSVASRVDALSCSRGASNVVTWREEALAPAGTARAASSVRMGRSRRIKGERGGGAEKGIAAPYMCKPAASLGVADFHSTIRGLTAIVDTPEQAAALELPPLLVRRPLEAFLDAHGL